MMYLKSNIDSEIADPIKTIPRRAFIELYNSGPRSI